jgi:hypothetical protein
VTSSNSWRRLVRSSRTGTIFAMASEYGIAYTLALVAAQPLGTAFDPNGEWTAAAAARFRYVITRQERGADHSSSTHARPEAMRAFNPRSRRSRFRFARGASAEDPRRARPGLCAHTTVERQVHEEEGAGRAIYLETRRRARHGVAESQAFIDANERSALVAMLTFLETPHRGGESVDASLEDHHVTVLLAM